MSFLVACADGTAVYSRAGVLEAAPDTSLQAEVEHRRVQTPIDVWRVVNLDAET